jgi:hypothetical protein
MPWAAVCQERTYALGQTGVAHALNWSGASVPAFRANFHQHLPHYALTTEDTKSIRLLARQPIDLTNPHPFIEAGNTEFNMFLWMPPTGTRAGHILLADSTIFTTLFGGSDSLDNFWYNLATKG